MIISALNSSITFNSPILIIGVTVGIGVGAVGVTVGFSVGTAVGSTVGVTGVKVQKSGVSTQ